MRISITFGQGGREAAFRGDLNESAAAQALAAALPVTGRANVWGEELYWAVPVKAGLDPDASDLREVGDLAYWPPGQAFCIFFGRTPASHGGEPRAASAVNLIGRLELADETVAALKAVPSGAAVTIAAADAQA